MTFCGRLLASTTALGLAAFLPGQANAGLLGAGRTVQAFYYNGVFASPEGEIPVGGSSSTPTSISAAVDYQQGAADGSTIDVADVQITITNMLSGAPFCVLSNVGTACTDAIDGFDFKFTGENILGVSVDATSSINFQPATFTSHLGLQLLSNNEIRVDVTGDEPALNDQLVLDLQFVLPPPPPPPSPPPPPPPTNAPEPATLALLGSAIAGLAGVRRRRKL
jgi:hypothetical protein